MTKLAFIGAGSTIFMKNIVGDMLHFDALKDATIALMDIDETRLAESEAVAKKMIATMGTGATVETTTDQRRALDGADFVVTAFQIGGYDPCTITDFDLPKRYGLRQTIADTLGVGGIMRGLRTVPHLWRVAEDMAALCPDALLLLGRIELAAGGEAFSLSSLEIVEEGWCAAPPSAPTRRQPPLHDPTCPGRHPRPEPDDDACAYMGNAGTPRCRTSRRGGSRCRACARGSGCRSRASAWRRA